MLRLGLLSFWLKIGKGVGRKDVMGKNCLVEGRGGGYVVVFLEVKLWFVGWVSLVIFDVLMNR